MLLLGIAIVVLVVFASQSKSGANGNGGIRKHDLTPLVRGFSDVKGSSSYELAGKLVGASLVADGIGATKDSVGIPSVDTTTDRAGKLVAASAGAVLASIFGGALAFVALIIAEAVLIIGNLQADEKLLKKGRNGANQDFYKICNTVRDNLITQLTTAGADLKQSQAAATLLGWYLAVGYNNAANGYWTAKHTGVTHNSLAAHLSFWADRSLLIPQDVIAEWGKTPTSVVIPATSGLANIYGGASSTGTNIVGGNLAIFSLPGCGSVEECVATAGTLWSGPLFDMANVAGLYLWCGNAFLMGLDFNWDSSQYLAFQASHWTGQGSPAQQAAKLYFSASGLGIGAFKGFIDDGTWDPADGAVKSQTGIAWLAEETARVGKPQLIFLG